MGELFVAGVTTIDILVIYVLLDVHGRKIIFALWTAILNMFLPLIGFLLGEFTTLIFAEWSMLLSGLLLGLIGLHMLLEEVDEPTKMIKIPPVFLAFVVSIDAFTVSVTLGMLQFNKVLFILASGIFALIFSLIALYFQKKLNMWKGKRIRQFAGVVLILMGIYSCIY